MQSLLLMFEAKINMIYVYCITYCILFGLSQQCNGEISSDESYTQAIEKEIKGTLFESDGLECDETCIEDYLQSAAEYTRLYLFLKDNKQNYSEIVYGNLTSFKVSGFDHNRKTKILVHGWMEYAFDGFATDLRDSYFASSEDVNVLSVDWSEVANLLYPLARLYVVPVGKFMATFVDWLVLEAGVSIGSMHVIGLSLGAHVAGTIGEHVTTGQVARITGLDPAGPGFSSSTSGRLDSSDAQFVDIIHTCGHWAGYYDPSGDVDFYPNKGMYNQPGCSLDLGVCSHKRSYHLFNESINSKEFVARHCDSWDHYVDDDCDEDGTATMGEHVHSSAQGLFYLHTADSYPFALGADDIQHDDSGEL